MSAAPEKNAARESQLDANQIKLLRMLRGGTLLPQLIRTWREQAPRQLTDLAEAVERADHQTVSTLAHSLKSASHSIGARFVGDACAALEQAARSGDLSNAVQLLAQLQQKFLQVQPELEQYLS